MRRESTKGRHVLTATSLFLLLTALVLPLMAEDGEGQAGMWSDDFLDESKIYSKTNAKAVAGNMMIYQLATDYDWKKGGMVLDLGPSGSREETTVAHPMVLKGHDGLYRMWYSGTSSTRFSIFYATSLDGRTWTKHGILGFKGLSGTTDDMGGVRACSAFYEDELYKIWYTGRNLGSEYTIHQAVSPNGVNLSYAGKAIPQGGGDWSAAYPSVLNDGGTYKMWYSRLVSGVYWEIAYATSPEGVNWTKHGVVMARDPFGPDDRHLIKSVVVKNSTGNYRMWYSGMGTNWRILYAESPDGIDWSDRRGIVMYEGGPGELDESHVIPGSVRLPLPHAGWMWYTGRNAGGNGRIFIATMGSVGSFMTTEITKDVGYNWDKLYLNKTVIPGETEVLISVIDASTMEVIPGFSDLSGDTIDLSSIDRHTTDIRLRAEMFGTITDTPLLEDWTVTWKDRSGPDFNGLKHASDDGTGGNVTLSWDSAIDPSPPITYKVYMSLISLAQDFDTPDYTTQEGFIKINGLQNGVEHYFIVRAEDSLEHEDNNTVEKVVIPTTPVDSTPPDFAGLQSVTDLAEGGNVTLSWSAATDLDTAESNSDPSLPITYNIYYSSFLGGQDFSVPNQTTSDTQSTITGLRIGVTYYFVARAMDAAGNEEDNTVEVSVMPTTEIDTTPPDFDGLHIVLVDDDNGGIHLAWRNASDPDNPGCPNDPSTPVRFNIYMSDTPTGFDFSQPFASTELQNHDFLDLERGITYYFIVRAVDAVGNEETNSVMKSGSLKVLAVQEEFDFMAYWWVILIVIMVLLAVIIAFSVKRRKKEEPIDKVDDEDVVEEAVFEKTPSEK